jgi:hypothetical protein
VVPKYLQCVWGGIGFRTPMDTNIHRYQNLLCTMVQYLYTTCAHSSIYFKWILDYPECLMWCKYCDVVILYCLQSNDKNKIWAWSVEAQFFFPKYFWPTVGWICKDIILRGWLHWENKKKTVFVSEKQQHQTKEWLRWQLYDWNLSVFNHTSHKPF